MINSVNVPVQTVALVSPVLFASDRIKTGCSVRHEAGSGRFVLTKPGIYKVTFNGVLSAADTGTAVLNLYQDGEQVPAAQTQVPVGAAVVGTGTFTTLIRVYGCGSSTVSVVNNSTIPITVTNASMTIDRLC